MCGFLIKILPALLVLYPVLNIYSLPAGYLIPIGDVTIIIAGSILLLFRKGNKMRLPKELRLFWIYIGVAYFITNLNYFKISNFIPGGFSFCSMIFTLVVCLRYLDFNRLKTYYKFAVICFSILLIIQEVVYETVGIRPLFILPNLPLANGQDIEGLIVGQTTLARSSACFREPAHLAVYILPVLFFELFDTKKKDSTNESFLTSLGVFLIIILVILRSGNGFLGLSFLLFIKFIKYYKNNSSFTKLVVIFLVSPFMLFGIIEYTQSEHGSEILERAKGVGFNENSESYDRTFRGYRLYIEFPVTNMIMGMSQNQLSSFIRHSDVRNQFLVNGEDDTYMNGIQNVLIHYGIIGLVLYLSLFEALFKKSDKYSRIFISLYLLLMMVSDLFISFSFILCIFVSQYRKLLASTKIRYNFTQYV